MLYDPNWKQTDTPSITRTDLSKRELKYLLQVRGLLISGAITSEHFEMNTFWGDTPKRTTIKALIKNCDSVGCIGGWMAALARTNTKSILSDSGFPEWVDQIATDRFMSEYKWHYLFYPPSVVMLNARPEHAVIAIDNFLIGQKDPWQFMMKKEKGRKYAI